MEPRGWYNRGYLPHFDGGQLSQAVTFALHDCYPRHLIPAWKEELRYLADTEAEMERRRRIEDYLDKEQGKPWLRDPYLADLVQNTMWFHAGKRYLLHAWVVMPTHAHALLTPLDGTRIDKILHSWKSYSANQANTYLHRDDPFWIHESYDRYIRDERHFANEMAYIENNPVKAGLCQHPEDWPWSSAAWKKKTGKEVYDGTM